MKKKILFLLAATTIQVSSMVARPNIDQKPLGPSTPTRAGCSQPTDVKFLDVNNVRALIMNGSDMWWDRDLGNPAYEVPYNRTGTGTKKNALFAGALWVGGIDAGSGLLKVAAQTYRQNSEVDWWTGPVDKATVDITASECASWDKIWKVEKSQINKFRAIFAEANGDTNKIKQFIAAKLTEVPDVIKEWPASANLDAKGKGGVPLSLSPTRTYAPFEDQNGNGRYEWLGGDYPRIKGDQMLWWLFNDVGSVKTATNTVGIGLEVSASAFAFSTNDVLNEATFYEYNIINRGTSTLDSTYFSTWTDADLGDYQDDYVGCDVPRSLGILYNGDNYDGGEFGYGNDIPMIGIDFFQGPKLRRIGLPDSTLGMTAFTYFNNNNDPQLGNPSQGTDFYNYMSGKLRNGIPFVKTCSGTGTGTPFPFVFANEFRECNPCNNAPFDRRFIHSSGPLTLFPGADNDIIIGAIWVPSVGGGCASFGKIQAADDVAQSLFDNGFKLPFGPMAPDMKVIPYDKKLVFYLNNPIGSNNYNESYGNPDSSAKYKESSIQAAKNGSTDSLYEFEGYIVYQLKNSTISFSEIRRKDGTIDDSKAKVVFQCDKQNGVSNLINYETDPTINGNVYNAKLMVVGSDKGIKNNFAITEDAFAVDNKTLVNYKMYHYMVVAYAKNDFLPFDPANPAGTAVTTYRESRTDGREAPLRVYSIMPTPAFDNVYLSNQVAYGSGIEVTRLEGTGNAGLNIEMTEASETEALAPPYIAKHPSYRAGTTPIQIRVTNPDSIRPGNYQVWLTPDTTFTLNTDSTRGLVGAATKWFITRDNAGVTGVNKRDTIFSEQTLANFNEQLLLKWNPKSTSAEVQEDWGFSVGTGQGIRPGDNPNSFGTNGFITSSITYRDSGVVWLSGVKDVDGDDLDNWLRCGTSGPTGATTYNIAMGPYAPFSDPNCNFTKMVDGTWGPYNLANRENQTVSRIGVQYYKNLQDRTLNPLSSVNSVDIVFTNDRSKWSRCAVVEMNDGAALAQNQTAAPFSENGAFKYTLRKHASLNKEPDANGNPVYDASEEGRSWFPGYAINQETGERLNVVFGEDSGDPVNNGTDMIYNPTNQIRDFSRGGLVMWGGHHVVYVLSSRYDECNEFYNTLKGVNNDPPGANPPTPKQAAWRKASWVSPTAMNGDFKLKSWKEGLIPTETRVKLRVSRPYNRFVGPGVTPINQGFPVYQFNLDKIAPAPLSSANNPYNTDEKALLDRIMVTPNPYYAYSAYETGRLDNRVRIINLPEVAEISIYGVDGSLIRTLKKNDRATTFVDWDLKNTAAVPVASGMYLMHVKIQTAQGPKETILKWYGIMRPQDITQF